MNSSFPAWLAVGALAVFVFGLFAAARSAQRLLVVEVVRGVVKKADGRAPPTLLQDFDDVLAKTKTDATVVLLVRRGEVTVETNGEIDEAVTQRLRNVVGRFPAARLRTAPLTKRRR